MRRFCAACKDWHVVREPHLCPAEDGDRAVTVPLAALRAVVEGYREDSDFIIDDRSDDGGRWAVEREARIGALGVPGL